MERVVLGNPIIVLPTYKKQNSAQIKTNCTIIVLSERKVISIRLITLKGKKGRH